MKFVMKVLAALSVLLFASYTVQDVSSEAVQAETKATYKNINVNKLVNAKGGLIVRATADTKGKKVTMLKDGSKVFVYSEGTNGWSYVKQGKFKGYVKTSYLKNVPKAKKRVVDFSMSISEVKQMEPAKLVQQEKDGNETALLYNVSKYGYNADLIYLFNGDKLELIMYDFLPEGTKYYTGTKLTALFNSLSKKATQDFGKGEFISEGKNSFSNVWFKKDYDIVLDVTNEDKRTEAVLVYYKEL